MCRVETCYQIYIDLIDSVKLLEIVGAFMIRIDKVSKSKLSVQEHRDRRYQLF